MDEKRPFIGFALEARYWEERAVSAEAALGAALARAEALEKALSWYADEKNYLDGVIPGTWHRGVDSPSGPAEAEFEPDGGYRAEQVLKGRP